MEAWVADLCRAMPKVELHLHLDGALQPKTALDLASARQWRDFETPLSYRQMHSRLGVPHPLTSQKELLSYFAIPGLLLGTPEALRRVTHELILEKAADNVCYCEIRWAPQLHTEEGLSTGNCSGRKRRRFPANRSYRPADCSGNAHPPFGAKP